MDPEMQRHLKTISEAIKNGADVSQLATENIKSLTGIAQSLIEQVEALSARVAALEGARD